MKKLSALVPGIVIVVAILTALPCGAKYVDPNSEFLIAGSIETESHLCYPSVYGSTVAWFRGWQAGGGVFYTDLNAGDQMQIGTGSNGDLPSVNGDRIVWADTNADTIFIYDLSTGNKSGVIIPPSTPKPNPRNAKAYGDHAVWHNDSSVNRVNLNTEELFIIAASSNPTFADYYGVDIYGENVVWGDYGIWTKNLSSGQTLRITTESLWPYGPLIWEDIVVWMNQPTNSDYTLGPWAIYGTNLRTGEIFTIAANPSFHFRTLYTDMDNGILLFTKDAVGSSFSQTELWGLDLFSKQTFLISGALILGAGIYGDLIVYSRDGSIYGNYIQTLDADADGIDDDWENAYGLDSARNDASEDPDTDGLTNLQEYQNRTNPKVSDTDSDGMPDGWEKTQGLNPLLNDASGDPDTDDLTNLQEYQNGTNPIVSDTDSDGMPDKWEVDYNLNPLVNDASGDTDNDGFSNLYEYQNGMNPIVYDGFFYFIPSKTGGGAVVYF